MSTPDFTATGLLRLPAAIAPDTIAHMVERAWASLAANFGIVRADPATWTHERPTGFQALTRTDTFAAIGAAPQVTAALDSLFGARHWRAPKHWGAPLFTFPVTQAWAVPHAQWHLDFTVGERSDALPGVRVFALLSDVTWQGGSTLVVAGSHRLVQRLVAEGALSGAKSPQVRRKLMERYAWFEQLCSDGPHEKRQTLMEQPTSVDGVSIQVVPVCGRAGDVILMHPWCLHAPSPNVTSAPRIMVSESIFSLSTADQPAFLTGRFSAPEATS